MFWKSHIAVGVTQSAIQHAISLCEKKEGAISCAIQSCCKQRAIPLRNLTELHNHNDTSKHTSHAETGGIAFDVLPTGSRLSLHLQISILEQMPRRGNPAHSHFRPLLPSPPIRPRNLHQQSFTMKTTRRTSCGLERAKAKEDRAWERAMTKKEAK